MHRRIFLSLLSVAGLAALLDAGDGQAASTPPSDKYPDAFGVLHDSARCIGCRKCEAGCRARHADLLPEPDKPFDDLSVLEKKRRTDYRCYTVVNKYTVKGRETPVFRKIQCNHCLEPACVSACFVKALTKTEQGPVVYNPGLCVGCRYCMVACPFYIPAYDYGGVLNPLVYKCDMCAPFIAKGELPACVESCPKEALNFGKRNDLLRLARERMRTHPARYVPHIYGEKEAGGTSWLYIAPTAHTALGQQELGASPLPQRSAGIMEAACMTAGIAPVLLGGAYLVRRRRDEIAASEREAAVKEAVDNAAAETAAKLKTAAEEAAKDKETAIAREVKKAREETLGEIQAQTAAAGDSGGNASEAKTEEDAR
ncbi:MAG: 4Fe-4S dicluster domain-containing protein [Desulfovibrio sp.]|nr:4Fe-4S dicluster domain-containing protein [Desulfovibrio sp.]